MLQFFHQHAMPGVLMNLLFLRIHFQSQKMTPKVCYDCHQAVIPEQTCFLSFGTALFFQFTF
jgi:hypothetical protein